MDSDTDPNNQVDSIFRDDKFTNTNTIFNILEQHEFSSWAIFWQCEFPPLSGKPYIRNMFPKFETIANINSHFHDFTSHFVNMAASGTLPFFSYIEPKWGGEILGYVDMGNDNHPPSDTTPGERMLKQIYSALQKNQEAFAQTLLVIVFDEHGGTYDHFPPPWGATPPWGDGDPPPLQYSFNFDRFGVRVPAILVSPLIEKGVVFRAEKDVPYDHTSIIATLIKLINNYGAPKTPISPGELGHRVAKAPTFENVLTRSVPRSDNIFDRAQPIPNGTPLQFGMPFQLKHQSGKYIINASKSDLYYYPKLGDISAAVLLDFRFGWGNVLSGAAVQIHTSEWLPPWEDTASAREVHAKRMREALPPIVFAGIRNFLGAWDLHSDCYYWSSEENADYMQEYWLIYNAGGSTSINYGDAVILISNYKNQGLSTDGEYLNTNASDWWTIESPY